MIRRLYDERRTLQYNSGSSDFSPQPGTDDLFWEDLCSKLSDHIHSYNQNVASGSTQGASNVRTKIVGDCHEGAGLIRGNRPDERDVRSECRSAGFPIP
jgi:hypothetical protein